MAQANEEMCLLIQVETREGIENLDQILNVPGIHGVFFGAADLAASFGLPGQSNHPQIVEQIISGLNRVRERGLAGGVLCSDQNLNQQYMAAGANFVAIGVDALLLTGATSQLLSQYRENDASISGSY
jgi:4-hydroxy-2-oxoheptanedioate aldolase